MQRCLSYKKNSYKDSKGRRIHDQEYRSTCYTVFLNLESVESTTINHNWQHYDQVNIHAIISAKRSKLFPHKPSQWTCSPLNPKKINFSTNKKWKRERKAVMNIMLLNMVLWFVIKITLRLAFFSVQPDHIFLTYSSIFYFISFEKFALQS